MDSPASPAVVSRPRIRSRFASLVALAAGAGLTLFSASCSTSSTAAPGFVSAPGGVQVSSIQATPKTTATEWNPESLPFSGDAHELFDDLGPDYFAELLRNIPEVD